MRSSASRIASAASRSASKRASHSAPTVSALRAAIHSRTCGLSISSSQRWESSSMSLEFMLDHPASLQAERSNLPSLAHAYAAEIASSPFGLLAMTDFSLMQSRAAHQGPKGIERRRLAERLHRGEYLTGRLSVYRLHGAVHELFLDLFACERKLRRAARIIAQLLDPAAVLERHDDARRALRKNLAELRIDRDRHQARGLAHASVLDRTLRERCQHRRAMHQRVGGQVGHAELGVLDRGRIFAADTLRRVARDAGRDAGDVGKPRQQRLA